MVAAEGLFLRLLHLVALVAAPMGKVVFQGLAHQVKVLLVGLQVMPPITGQAAVVALAAQVATRP